MKIVCDACQAKYSISDDKVQGKVFKIRCKKCSNIIVVRGGAGAAEPAPATQEKDTRVYDYGYDGGDQPPAGDDAVWHLVINQDQVGPMTVAEVQQRFAAGEVDGETFAWREGFADWLPLAQVDTFAALVASGSTTAAVGGGGAAAVSAMFGGVGDDSAGTTRSDPGDLFAASSGASHHHHDDDGGDLFGSKPAAHDGGANAQKLRGERNENSVLFSLNNLAQLASDKPAPSPSVVSAPSGHATGAAGGEGSGLIDIRSMASAYLGGSGAAPGKPAASAGIGTMDDLPVFGGGGFSEPAVIVPTARAAANNKVLYMMLAAVGVLAVAAIVLVIVLVHGSGKKTVVVAANDKPAAAADKPGDKATADNTKPAATGDQPAATGDQAAAAAPAAGSATPAPEAAAPAEAAKPDDHAEHAAPAHEEHHAASHAAPHHEAVASRETHHEAAHPEAAAKPADSGGGGCDEVSCVLNSYAGACCAKFKHGGGGGGGGGGHADSNLPEQLDADMVGRGIASVKGRVSACGARSSAKGIVKVHVKVSGEGRVSSVSVLSSPDPGLGSCVQQAVYHASFPKTQRGGSFAYPFVP